MAAPITTPADVWDVWFLTKTFGPGVLTASFAAMAFTVAWSQREIAANKYKLDLFGERYEVYQKIEPVYEKIKNITNIHELSNYTKNIREVEEELKKSFRLCENISKNDIEKLKELLRLFEEKERRILKIIDRRGYKQYETYMKDETNDDIINQRIEKIKERIKGSINNIYKIRRGEIIDNGKKIFPFTSDVYRYKSKIKYSIGEIRETIKEIEPNKIQFEEYKILRDDTHAIMNDIKNIFAKIYSELDQNLDIKHEPFTPGNFVAKSFFVIGIILYTAFILYFINWADHH